MVLVQAGLLLANMAWCSFPLSSFTEQCTCTVKVTETFHVCWEVSPHCAAGLDVRNVAVATPSVVFNRPDMAGPAALPVCHLRVCVARPLKLF